MQVNGITWAHLMTMTPDQQETIRRASYTVTQRENDLATLEHEKEKARIKWEQADRMYDEEIKFANRKLMRALYDLDQVSK